MIIILIILRTILTIIILLTIMMIITIIMVMVIITISATASNSIISDVIMIKQFEKWIWSWSWLWKSASQIMIKMKVKNNTYLSPCYFKGIHIKWCDCWRLLAKFEKTKSFTPP